MMKHFMFTSNLITLQLSSENYVYQWRLDYLTFPAILKFSMKHLNTIKISKMSLVMTTNFSTNQQITKMKIKVNFPKSQNIQQKIM